MYTVKRTPHADRQLRKLPKAVALRIISALEALAEDPFAANKDTKKLSGRPGYRLRVGDYRALYEIHRGELVLLLVEVGHRREVYT